MSKKYVCMSKIATCTSRTSKGEVEYYQQNSGEACNDKILELNISDKAEYFYLKCMLLLSYFILSYNYN